MQRSRDNERSGSPFCLLGGRGSCSSAQRWLAQPSILSQLLCTAEALCAAALLALSWLCQAPPP